MTASKFEDINKYASTFNLTDCRYTEFERPDLDLDLPRALHACLGLASELAELEEAATVRHRLEEIGDLVWFTSLLAQALNMDTARLWEDSVYRSAQSVYDRDRPGAMTELGHVIGALCDRFKALLFYRSTDLKPFAEYGDQYKRDRGPVMDVLHHCTWNLAYAVARVADDQGLEHGQPGAGLFTAMRTNLAKLAARERVKTTEGADARDYQAEALAVGEVLGDGLR